VKHGRTGEVTYTELFGRIEPTGRKPISGDAVILSSLEQTAACSPPVNGLCIRYVGRGRENYRIGGRGCRLDTEQLMISPQQQGAEFEVRRDERSGTVGLCVLIHDALDEIPWEFGPLVASAAASSLGDTMRRSTKALWNGARPKQELATQLVGALRTELPLVARKILAQTASADAAKPATRFEMVRVAHLAQAYLHGIISRAVDLPELAGEVGKSPFQLLRAFQHCFAETPASYHRKLRLNLALAEARRRGVSIGAVCDEFGFSGASSFSHAYRRAFGQAPVWSRRDAA